MARVRSLGFLFVALLCGGMVCADAQSTPPSADQQFEERLRRFDAESVTAAREYMQILNMKQSLMQAIPAMRDGILRQIKIKNPNINDADAKDFMDEFFKVAFVDNGDLLEKMTLVLTLEVFDKTELIAVRDFYQSPVGRRVLTKLPQLMGRMPELQGMMQRHILPQAALAAQAKLKAKGRDLRL